MFYYIFELTPEQREFVLNLLRGMRDDPPEIQKVIDEVISELEHAKMYRR
jgi:hypothetical protein